MKRSDLHRFVAAALVGGIGLLPVSTWAGPDFQQKQLYQSIHEAKMKLKEVEAAKGSERQKLLAQHLKMMQDVMDKMKAMKPKPGMSMQEHEEWISEHQKLMEAVFGQMMKEHHMLMDMNQPMDGGNHGSHTQ